MGGGGIQIEACDIFIVFQSGLSQLGVGAGQRYKDTESNIVMGIWGRPVERTSAQVHISPLYLMGHVRDGGPNYKTQVVAFLVHVPVPLDKIRGSGTFFSSPILLPCNHFWTFHILFE